MESIGIAIQVYLIGFILSFLMACIIKLIMMAFNRGKKNEAQQAAADAASGISGEEAQA